MLIATAFEGLVVSFLFKMQHSIIISCTVSNIRLMLSQVLCMVLTSDKVENKLLCFFQFEYQQAQLEAEIENLSWKIERAESTDRGDLENQMDIAEKRRTTLLKDFLEV